MGNKSHSALSAHRDVSEASSLSRATPSTISLESALYNTEKKKKSSKTNLRKSKQVPSTSLIADSGKAQHISQHALEPQGGYPRLSSKELLPRRRAFLTNVFLAHRANGLKRRTPSLYLNHKNHSTGRRHTTLCQLSSLRAPTCSIRPPHNQQAASQTGTLLLFRQQG